MKGRWGVQPSQEGYERAIRMQGRVETILNEIIARKGYDDLAQHRGLRAGLTVGEARAQDLFANNYNYLKNEIAGRVIQIEVEEKPKWKFEEDMAGRDEEVIQSYYDLGWRFSLIKDKIDCVNVKYNERDVYVLMPFDVGGNTCLWWKFGEVQLGVYEGEWDETIKGYYRKHPNDRKGLGVGWDALVEYLVKVWRQKFD